MTPEPPRLTKPIPNIAPLTERVHTLQVSVGELAHVVNVPRAEKRRLR